jgi:hypothetical protein
MITERRSGSWQTFIAISEPEYPLATPFYAQWPTGQNCHCCGTHYPQGTRMVVRDQFPFGTRCDEYLCENCIETGRVRGISELKWIDNV